MTRVFALAVALWGFAFLLTPRTALAEPPNSRATPVYILSIWTNDSDDQADALTQQLRSRVRQAPGWSLLDASQSFETLAIALRCPPTPNQACLDRIGEQLHADHYVWGTMAKEKAGEVTADVRMWTRGKPSIEASETYSENLKDPSDDALRTIAARLIAKVTSTGVTGSLVVRAGSGRGTVVVDGVAMGSLDAGSLQLNVPVGEHKIAVRVSGFTAEAQNVTVTDGSEQALDFALTPETTAAAPAESAPEAEGPAHRVPVRRIVGYSLLGAGAVALVVAGIEGGRWLSDKSASDSDRANIPTSLTDVCLIPYGTPKSVIVSAEDACMKGADAKQAATLGWVFAAVGAALGGTGLVLLMTDPGASSGASTDTGLLVPGRPRFDVIPTLGPHLGALDVRMTF
jgi:hypothetical protein